MKPILTTNNITRVKLSEIRASTENPRGAVKQDASFERLVSSIKEVGILVPLVVQLLKQPLGNVKYELVDGERRYLAALRLRQRDAPAHIVEPDVGEEDLRRFMFHLHMTREQWEPLAQVKSLSEMYPDAAKGISVSEKPIWAKRVAAETWMNAGTARDRVHILAWAPELREQILEVAQGNSDKDIYSYVLALEASIIDPAFRAFPEYAKGSDGDKKANDFRKSLLAKVLNGIELGTLASRDQIREIGVLFSGSLSDEERRYAKAIFHKLVTKPLYTFDDAKSDIEVVLPQLLAEKPVKPRKVFAMMQTLANVLDGYKPEFIDAALKRATERAAMRQNFRKASKDLIDAAEKFRGRLRNGK
jgi:ParB-like nuclease family protein